MKKKNTLIPNAKPSLGKNAQSGVEFVLTLFRKTIDNRFVLKEMSKQEVKSFLEFAPQYVQYISNSIQNNVILKSHSTIS